MQWAPGCTHTSLRTPHKRAQTHSRSLKGSSGSLFWSSALLLHFTTVGKKKKKKSTVSDCMLLLSVLSSYLYGTTNPAQPARTPPLPLTNAVALISPVSFTTGSGAESRTERAGRLIETSPKCQVAGCTAKSRPNLVMLLRVNLFIRQHLSATGIFWSCWVGGAGVLSKKVRRGWVIKGAWMRYSF